MRSWVIAGCMAAATTLAGAASAQEWDGFYVGGHLGGVALSGDFGAFTPRNGYAGFGLSDMDGNGMIGGLHAGRSWDMGSYVLGVEAGLSAGGVHEESTQSTIGSVPVFSRDLDGLLTVAGRLGVPVGNALVYGRTGAAVGRFTSGHDQNGTWISETETRTGWLVGLGAEGRLADNMTWRIDLSHMDFGDFRTDITGPGAAIWTQQEATVQTLTVGFNYWFN
ncbi:outer membrane protein [Roseicyclus persicicus]|uniref:Porin family protein n=1 Tax=Roseicyclus persicicus TaxID=2650661 RepID=A0A7X6H1E0_9RHOB|nr:outer membrane beta-barrel protein [Roseibacterium persicicum]NKX46233.1 porin family protein [Roseibacterium persicicum]